MVEDKEIVESKDWLSRIESARRWNKAKWSDDAKTSQQVYEGKLGEHPVYLPIHSNIVNVQQGAIITRAPNAVVSGNSDVSFSDDIAAQVYEKCLNAYAKESDYGSVGICATRDYIISGWGVIRVERQGDKIKFIHVSWRDLTIQPSKSWDDCEWIAIDHYVDYEEMNEKYPDVVYEESAKKNNINLIHEIWCKKSGMIHFVSSASKEVLESKSPEFRHKNFFPITQPRLLDKKTNEFCPIVEFSKWEKLHKIVNRITVREEKISENIVPCTFYDSSNSIFPKHFTRLKDNAYYPVNGDAIRNQEGKLDLSQIAVSKDNSGEIQSLLSLSDLKDKILSQIYQITGISQEMQQGISDFKETATAQKIKQGWGTSRLEVKRRDIQGMIKDGFFLAAEIMSQIDQAELVRKSGLDIDENQLAQLDQFVQNGGITDYTFDIDTSTMIAIDEKSDNDDKLEMIKAVTGFANGMMQAVQSKMIPFSIYVELLKMSTSTFGAGRALKDELDMMAKNHNEIEQMTSQIQQLQQQLQESQQQGQLMQMELGRRDQMDMQKTAAETELKASQAAKTKVEAVQKANEIVVDQFAMQDELNSYATPPGYAPVQQQQYTQQFIQ